MKSSYPELPIKVQLICYHQSSEGLHVLLLKRVPEDGGFWQTLTETLEFEESLAECIPRALSEEIGITHKNDYHVHSEIHRFSWIKKDSSVVELVYPVEIFHQDIQISQEHSEYQWKPLDQAIDIIGKSNTKDCLKRFQDFIDQSL